MGYLTALKWYCLVMSDFWDRGRRLAIESLLKSVGIRDAEGKRALAGVIVGAPGSSAEALSHFCEKLVSVEPGLAGQFFAEKPKSFDLVSSFDVLDMLEDDLGFLKALSAGLNEGGRVLLSGAASRRLWSSTDVFARRFRRYSREELVSKVEACGFRVERTSYFYRAVFSALWISNHWRDFLGGSGARDSQAHAIPGFVGRLIDRRLVREASTLRHEDLNYGAALFCVARKIT